MAELEERLAQAVARRPGFAADGRRRGARRRRQAAAAAASASSPRRAPRASRRSRPASRSSSCTWRRSSTTTSSTARACAAARRPPGRSSAPDAALSAGDYLFACAFAELAATGDSAAVGDARRRVPRLARGEALQRRQTHDPETTIDAYLERCALKTGKLFEAACLLGSGGDRALGAYGLSLGIAFQIADDILDCAGQTQETGKIPGTDLREGTPTMPLLSPPQQDEVVRARARRRPARRRARARRRRPTRSRARARRRSTTLRRPARSSAPSTHREELEALTYAVVDRASYVTVAIAVDNALDLIRDKVEAGERLDLEDGLALIESDDLLAIGELADLARRAPRRRRPRLLRPEPLPEPDERLPREVQVLRVRGDAEAGARLHAHARRARRGRGARSAS